MAPTSEVVLLPKQEGSGRDMTLHDPNIGNQDRVTGDSGPDVQRWEDDSIGCNKESVKISYYFEFTF